jgi:hypothetical protein
MPTLLSALLFAGLVVAPLAAQTSPTTTNSPPGAPTATEATIAVPLTTAVLDFQSSDESLSKQGGEIATLLEADLSSSPHAIMVERQDVEKILNEQELGASGLVSVDTAARIGSLTGAQVLITGRIFTVGNQFMVVAKIISAETSRVYGITANVADPGNLTAPIQELAGKIDGVLASHRDVLVVKEETSDERLQRLKSLLGNRPLPTVSVAISERDYSQPSIDPAAQTEITRDLLQLGFTVFDGDKDRRKPDIVITGEAFSETGARHGNLVSSRGRVEIKVVRRVSGALLWTDRETRVGVDVGDRSAGKQAIEQASGILVERMLPRLTK